MFEFKASINLNNDNELLFNLNYYNFHILGVGAHDFYYIYQ